MNLNIAAQLLRDDDKFWSIVRDQPKRTDYLNRLYKTRVNFVVLMFVFILITFVFQLMDGNTTVPLLMFGAQALVYLDTDSKIRTIRLYESLSITDKNS